MPDRSADPLTESPEIVVRFLAALVAVIEAWGRGEVTGYDVLDAAAAADAYLTAQGIPRDE